MKILYITSSFPCGPGESFLIPELAELSNRGHKVYIAPIHPRGKVFHESILELNLPLLLKPLLHLIYVVFFIYEFFCHPNRMIRSISILFQSRNKSILVKNFSVLLKASWLSWFCRKHKIEHIHAHWVSYSSTAALIASILSGIEWSFTAHRWDIVDNNLLELKIKKAKFCRFISSSGVRLASERVHEMPLDKMVVLHMGVKLPEFECREPIVNENPKVIVCPANLIEVKGHRYLIKAVKQLRDKNCRIDLWLIGDGPLKQELMDYCNQLHLTQSIRFVGQKPHHELMNLYKNGHVFGVVLPSVDLGNGEHEGIPVSLIEAMSFDIPVISTDTGGIPELLQNGAGIIVPHQNPTALAHAIETLVTDFGLRNEMIVKARFVLKSQFDIQIIVDQLVGHMNPEGQVNLKEMVNS
ncbi:glycosyltransferase family 4 protein [Paenibacillus koleovorans]|uniref:glycosyltransferase family 4 protein n=1 Tax=Paenibacillus koleovorans TaxID=121608 RepID=UPI000FDCAAF8|nr:glycosyltransferase family 4 protein [Paenibacillus koleovorans]